MGDARAQRVATSNETNLCRKYRGSTSAAKLGACRSGSPRTQSVKETRSRNAPRQQAAAAATAHRRFQIVSRVMASRTHMRDDDGVASRRPVDQRSDAGRVQHVPHFAQERRQVLAGTTPFPVHFDALSDPKIVLARPWNRQFARYSVHAACARGARGRMSFLRCRRGHSSSAHHAVPCVPQLDRSP
jgi:hypothetical protein